MNRKTITINISRKSSSMLKFGLSSLFAAFAISSLDAAPTVTASGYNTTASGVQHACTGGTVTLSVTGMTTTPPSGCCGNDSSASWEYDSTTYSWSGDASGSSATANLNTGSEGMKSASVTLTHKFKCSVGTGTTTTTESASLSRSIEVVTNDTAGCTPTPPTGGTLGIAGIRSVTNEYTLAYWSGFYYVEEWYTGTWSNTQATESFTPNGSVTPRPCGKELADQKNSGQVSLGLQYGIASWSYTFAGRNSSANVAAEKFKRINYQWYDYKVQPSTADFNGTADRKTTFFGNSSSTTYNNSGNKGLSGAAVNAGYDYSYCKVACCPSN